MPRPATPTARPFTTHHTPSICRCSADRDTEPHLKKRLVRWRFERGLRTRPLVPQRGHQHPPQPRVHLGGGVPAYADYTGHDGATEGADREAARRSAAARRIAYQGHARFDLTAPWRRATMHELVEQATGRRFQQLSSAAGQAAPRWPPWAGGAGGANSVVVCSTSIRSRRGSEPDPATFCAGLPRWRFAIWPGPSQQAAW